MLPTTCVAHEMPKRGKPATPRRAPLFDGKIEGEPPRKRSFRIRYKIGDLAPIR